nr:sterol desaturase family protein [Brevundimonas aurantiaca]
MLRDLLITTLALSLIIGLRYLLVGAAAHGLLWAGAGRGRALNLRPPAMKRIRAEIVASLIACPIYALPAALVLELWKWGGTAIYSDPDAWPLWWLPVSLIVYLLAHDAFYYWVHRALHHPRVFGWAHAEHHRSRDPSAFASFAFDPAEAAATAWFLPALALIVPIHWGVALTLLTLMSLTAALNHAGREVWPAAWLERAPLRWLITATHHDAHHKRFNGNYGLYFQFWDRWAGTEVSAAPSRPSPVIPPERPSAPLGDRLGQGGVGAQAGRHLQYGRRGQTSPAAHGDDPQGVPQMPGVHDEVQPVAVRHQNVHQHGVGRPVLDDPQPFVDRCCGQDLATQPFQHLLQMKQNQRIVLDHADFHAQPPDAIRGD